MTFNPILAKNTGDKSKYDSVSNLLVIYLHLGVFEIAMPAKNAPVISATPKKASALNDIIRQNTKLAITYRLKSLSLVSHHFCIKKWKPTQASPPITKKPSIFKSTIAIFPDSGDARLVITVRAIIPRRPSEK